MSADISIDKVRGDLERAKDHLDLAYQTEPSELARQNAHLMLTAAAQQRALETLVALVESDSKRNAAVRARFTFAESISS